MRDSEEILCGLTYLDIRNVAAETPNMRAAAKRLGVNESYFYKVVKLRGLQHLWPELKKPRPRCVSREDVARVAADCATRQDAADVLGISEAYLKDLIKEWGLSGLFTFQPAISRQDLERCARLRMTRMDIARSRDIPYNRVARAVSSHGLGHLFPGRYEGRKWVMNRA